MGHPGDGRGLEDGGVRGRDVRDGDLRLERDQVGAAQDVQGLGVADVLHVLAVDPDQVVPGVHAAVAAHGAAGGNGAHD